MGDKFLLPSSKPERAQLQQ